MEKYRNPRATEGESIYIIFKYISVILWRSVLFVEETGVSEEHQRSVASDSQTLSHKVVSSTSDFYRT